jgi:hypothetical protein
MSDGVMNGMCPPKLSAIFVKGVLPVRTLPRLLIVWTFHSGGNIGLSAIAYILPHLLFQKPLDIFLFWQFELVYGDKEVVVHAGDGVFDQGVVFLRTRQLWGHCPHNLVVKATEI